MTAAGGAANAEPDITQERNTPMAKTDETTAKPGDGTTPPVEPAAAAPGAPPETVANDAESAVAEANNAAAEPIKVRLTITPDIETELLGGEAERLDLERQGLVVTDDTEGSK